MFALLPLVLQLVPSLAQWLFGDSASDTQKKVTTAVQAVVGTADPEAAKEALSSSLSLQQKLTVELARIAASRQAEADAALQARLVAQLNDVAGARNQTVALAQAKSLVAWGAPVYSLMIVAAFVYAEYLAWHTPVTETTEQIGLLETLKMLTVAVGTYWVGSSAGSFRKTQALNVARDQLYHSVPATTVVNHGS